MPVSTQRVLDALDQLVSVTRDAVPGVYPSVQILLGELRRRDRHDLLGEHYARGHQLLTQYLSSPSGKDAAVEKIRQRMAAIPARLDTSLEWSRCQQQLQALMAVISDFCALRSYPAPEAPEFNAAVSALLAWEAVEGIAPPSDMPTVVPTRDKINAGTLQQVLQGAGGEWSKAIVSNVRQLGGGTSKSMVKFDVETPAGKETLVARIDSDVPVMDGVFAGMKVSYEYHLLRYVWRQGNVAIAQPRLYVGADNPLGLELFVSSCIPGVAKMDLRLSQQDPVSPALLDAIATLFVNLHRMPLDIADADLRQTHFALNPPRTRREAYQSFISSIERNWRNSGEPASPVIESTLRWLLANIPADDRPPCIAHSDCGLNNLMVEGDRVTGLVDWETPHYGSPAEDISCFNFVTQGVVDPRAFIDAYVRAGGEKPDEFSLRYHAVIARAKLLVARDIIRQLYQDRPLAKPELGVAAFVFGERTIADLNQAVQHADEVRPR